MKRLLCNIMAVCLILTIAGPALAGQSAEIRLKDGSRWRGEVSDMVAVSFLEQNIEVTITGELKKVADLYIVVDGEIGGALREKTIFRGDIVTMRTIDKDADAAKPTRRSGSGRTTSRPANAGEEGAPRDATGKVLGVHVLPLDGGVGDNIRAEEIKKMGEEADKYGPGQIIVLLINTNGGSALESQYISSEIMDIKKRHRVVAWIRKAISAGCQTAMSCDEIYFMTDGTAGAVTSWNPGSGQSIKGEELERSMEHLAEVAEKSGYSKYIAYAMKTNTAMCSYDKDPETGEVTFYDDLSGEVILSDENSNLSFTSSVALDCGFSKGTADTEEELAKLLDLPRWYEIDDYGRRLSKSWNDTVERAQAEIPRLIARMSYWKSSAGIEERLGAQIQIMEQFIRWWNRCPPVAGSMLPPKELLEREIAELRKQLADIRHRGR